MPDDKIKIAAFIAAFADTYEEDEGGYNKPDDWFEFPRRNLGEILEKYHAELDKREKR